MRSPDADLQSGSRKSTFLLAVLIFMAGFLSLALEVVYIRLLSLILGNTTYAISVILSSFLLGLAIGNLTAARRAACGRGYQVTTLMVFLALVNLAAYYLAMLVPLLFYSIHRLPGPDVFLFFTIQLIPCFLVVLLPSWGMGALYAACFVELEKTGAQSVEAYGQLFFLSTLGSIAGSLTAGFLFIPLLGIKNSIFLASAIYLLLGVLTGVYRCLGQFRIVGLTLLILLAVQQGLEPERPGEQFNFYMMSRCNSLEEMYSIRGNTRTLFHAEDREGTVLVLEDLRSHTRYLSVAGKVEGSSSMDMPNQALLALLPAAFTTARKRALNIGLGTGATLHYLATLDSPFQRIDSVELNQGVLDAMARYFYPELIGNSEIHHYVDDARHFLRTQPGDFDLITSEPSYPTDSGVSFLFTGEFFELIKSKLSSDGVFCQWLPAYLLDPATRVVFEDTLCERFPAVFRFRVRMSSDDLYICLPVERVMDSEALRAGLPTPEGFPAQLILSEQLAFECRLKPTGQALRNTDDHPILEFATVRNILQRLWKDSKGSGG